MVTGKVKTTARWIRDFVQNHPEYKHDSVVTDSINYDLLWKCAQVSESQFSDEKFTADTLLPQLVNTKTREEIPHAVLREQELYNKKHSRNGNDAKVLTNDAKVLTNDAKVLTNGIWCMADSCYCVIVVAMNTFLFLYLSLLES